MSETVDADLYTRTKALLEPGDIELAGCIVHTTLGGQEDLEMHELTVAINEVIADHAGRASRTSRPATTTRTSRRTSSKD